jgi:hypothetical protein
MKKFSDYLLENNCNNYKDLEDLKSAIDKFDNLPDSQKAKEAKIIINSSIILKYNLRKPEICKFGTYIIKHSDHAKQRFIERQPNYNKVDINKIIGDSFKIIKYSGEKLIFSKSKNFGIIVKFTFKIPNVFRIITILPTGKQFPKPGTELLTVESSFTLSNEFLNYFSEFVNNKNLNENYDYQKEIIIINDYKIKSIFVNSQLYDFEDLEIIEVE